MKVTGQLKFKCPICGHIESVESSNAFFEEAEVHERSMGTEKCHTTKCIHTCSQCGEELELVYNIWEYPIGTRNTNELLICSSNVDIIEDWNIDFITNND